MIAKTSINKGVFQSSKKAAKERDLKLWMINNKQSKPIVNPAPPMPLIAKESKSQSIPRIISNPLIKPAPSSPSISEKGRCELLISIELMMGRKDEATQTEEIFFKMHWSYFAGEYPIKVGKSHHQMNYNKVREQIMLRNKSFISNPLMNFSNKNVKGQNSFQFKSNKTNKPFSRQGFPLPKNYFS